jgi:hypothetical protein
MAGRGTRVPRLCPAPASTRPGRRSRPPGPPPPSPAGPRNHRAPYSAQTRQRPTPCRNEAAERARPPACPLTTETSGPLAQGGRPRASAGASFIHVQDRPLPQSQFQSHPPALRQVHTAPDQAAQPRHTRCRPNPNTHPQTRKACRGQPRADPDPAPAATDHPVSPQSDGPGRVRHATATPRQHLTRGNTVTRRLPRSGRPRPYTATAAGHPRYAPKSAGVIAAAAFNGPAAGAAGPAPPASRSASSMRRLTHTTRLPAGRVSCPAPGCPARQPPADDQRVEDPGGSQPDDHHRRCAAA